MLKKLLKLFNSTEDMLLKQVPKIVYKVSSEPMYSLEKYEVECLTYDKEKNGVRVQCMNLIGEVSFMATIKNDKVVSYNSSYHFTYKSASKELYDRAIKEKLFTKDIIFLINKETSLKYDWFRLVRLSGLFKDQYGY